VPFGMFSSVELGCLGLCLDDGAFVHFGGLPVLVRVAVVWKMVPLCILWCL